MKSAFTFDQNGQNKGIVVGANSGSIEAVLSPTAKLQWAITMAWAVLQAKYRNHFKLRRCECYLHTCMGAVDGGIKFPAPSRKITQATVSNCYGPGGITFTEVLTRSQGVCCHRHSTGKQLLSPPTSVPDKRWWQVSAAPAATAAQFAPARCAGSKRLNRYGRLEAEH